MKKNFFYAGGLSLLLWGMAACSGQGKADKAAVVADSVVVKTDSVAADSTGYIVKVGEPAPDFTITLTDGKQMKLSELRGKVVMLQFTASWCGVCRKEMPFIEKDIWLKHKNNPHFALIGIDLKENREQTIQFGKDLKITYPLTLDPEGKAFYSFAAQGAGVTRNIIIDKQGKIVFMTRLYDPEEFGKMCEVIDRLLD